MCTVWLASYPRSGVTLLRHIIERVYGLPTWTVYRETQPVSDVCDGSRYWPTDARKMPLPAHFVKTHSPMTASRDHLAIHLVRDGKDVVASYAHYVRDVLGDVRSLYTVQRDIIHCEDWLSSWGVHTLAWGIRDIPHITYDQLLADPIGTTVKAVESLGLGITPDIGATLKTFDELKKDFPDFYRVGRSGAGNVDIPRDLLDEFDERHGAAQRWFEKLNGGATRVHTGAERVTDLLSAVA